MGVFSGTRDVRNLAVGEDDLNLLGLCDVIGQRFPCNTRQTADRESSRGDAEVGNDFSLTGTDRNLVD